MITPVQQFGDWYAKRDDLAFFEPGRASGSKVRQYMAMAEASPGSPMVVGCSAFSAQQIYVADAAERTGRVGIVCVPKRSARTAATAWAAEHGAMVIEVSPGYPACYRKRAKEVVKEHGGCVRWNPALAVADAAAQCVNVPDGIKRVIVPTGSGLVAAGVLVGLAGRGIPVIAVAVSQMATAEGIAKAAKADSELLTLIRTETKYEHPERGELPDGTTLDPFYAAKCLRYLRAGDLLWVTGCRPQAAMPQQTEAA